MHSACICKFIMRRIIHKRCISAAIDLAKLRSPYNPMIFVAVVIVIVIVIDICLSLCPFEKIATFVVVGQCAGHCWAIKENNEQPMWLNFLQPFSLVCENFFKKHSIFFNLIWRKRTVKKNSNNFDLQLFKDAQKIEKASKYRNIMKKRSIWNWILHIWLWTTMKVLFSSRYISVLIHPLQLNSKLRIWNWTSKKELTQLCCCWMNFLICIYR